MHIKSQDGLIERLVCVRRYTKVTKGGRVFHFSAFVVVGNGEGLFGYSKKSAREMSVAINKALSHARKNLTQIHLSGHTISHTVKIKFGATKILMLPARKMGIVAGGPVRLICEVLGIKSIVAKIFGSKNQINVVKATVLALNSLVDPKQVILNRRAKLI